MGRRRRWRLAAGAGFGALLALHACASLPLPQVDDQLAAAAQACGLPLEQVVHGRQLLVTVCAGCHRPVHPLTVTLVDWDDVMPRMLRKAKLEPEAGEAVRAYVVAVYRLDADLAAERERARAEAPPR